MVRVRPIRLGISQCLLGEEVRYDGGHKRDRFLTDVLGRYVEWVPICPEVEAGLGTPREAMRLVGDPKRPRLITIKTERNLTKPLKSFSARKIDELQTLDLSGYVFNPHYSRRLLLQPPTHRYDRPACGDAVCWRAGSPLGRSTSCSRMPPSLAAPRARLAWRLVGFVTNPRE